MSQQIMAQFVEKAIEHLRDKGIEKFAFYALPASDNKPWSFERETHLMRIMGEYGYKIDPLTWQYSMNHLTDWLCMFPKGTGIVAVTDTRSRNILQAFDNNGIIVLDALSIIGMDNDRLAHHLTRIGLSSVNQAAKIMGFEAGKMLETILKKSTSGNKRLIVPAQNVCARQSTD